MAAPRYPGGNAGKGRRPGVPNKATVAVREIAQQYTIEAVETLAAVMRDPKVAPAARVSAATALLDRGYGRPTQPVAGDGGMPSIELCLEERQADAKASIEKIFADVLAKRRSPTIETDGNSDAAN